MLKRALVFAMIFMVILSSCSKSPVTGEEISLTYAKGFSFSANCDFYGEKLAAEVNAVPGKIGMKFSSPEVLKGLSVVCEAGETKFTYEGMEAEIDTDKILQKSPVREIYEFAESIFLPESFEISESGDEIIVTGNGFCAVLNGKDFSLKSVAFDNSGNIFNIENFTFM